MIEKETIDHNPLSKYNQCGYCGKIKPSGSGAIIVGRVTMRQIKNENLAQLLLQVRFAPPVQRQKQLDSAEKLLAIIDKEKEYPFEFVCFRITGYWPKGAVEQPIKGDELAEDLRIFISKLSGSCPHRG